MSISSILAFVLAGVAAFKGPRDRAEEKPTRTPYKALLAELSEAKAKIAELEDDVHRANVQFRRDQELIDMWRSRASEWMTRAAGRDEQWAMRQAQHAQAQLLHQAARTQHNAQLAQAAAMQAASMQQAHAQQQYGQGLASMGLLGAQSLTNAELWCNCVPSRSQVWATSDPE